MGCLLRLHASILISVPVYLILLHFIIWELCTRSVASSLRLNIDMLLRPIGGCLSDACTALLGSIRVILCTEHA